MELEFRPWPKIPRLKSNNVTITEKINGTNSCVVIQDGEIVAVQSRKRFITPEDDNYGFAGWVQENQEEIQKLGDGHHYGEWAGPGIQKNPHALEKKTLFLFNTMRWNSNNPNLPECCSVVPVLYNGELEANTINTMLAVLKDNAAEGITPEGVVVYYHALKTYSKETLVSPQGKWFDEK